MIGMGRRSRIHYHGAVYHAMARGVGGSEIFVDERDRKEFLDSLDRISAETGATIYAYCLMPNHFHLAIKVAAVPLGAVMQRILTGYSITFNRRQGRTGHLFQARYKAILCVDDRYLIALIRYIQMNPVRAGLVSHAADWPWSSRAPMALPDLESDSFNPWPGAKDRPVLSRPNFRRDETLEDIGGEICKATGLRIEELRMHSKRRDIVGARTNFARRGILQGHRLGEIAAWLNTKTESVSYYLRRNLTNLQA